MPYKKSFMRPGFNKPRLKMAGKYKYVSKSKRAQIEKTELDSYKKPIKRERGRTVKSHDKGFKNNMDEITKGKAFLKELGEMNGI